MSTPGIKNESLPLPQAVGLNVVVCTREADDLAYHLFEPDWSLARSCFALTQPLYTAPVLINPALARYIISAPTRAPPSN